MNRPYIKPDVKRQIIIKRQNKRGLLHRPHIDSDVIRQVKLRKIEEEKAALNRQREFVLEQQKRAFLQQQATETAQMISEELEENGMSM